MRLRTAVSIAACALSFFVACGGDSPKQAKVISPVFGDPCQNDPCAAHGRCAAGPSGGPMCLCEPGYAGAICANCETGFHLDALKRCVTNKSCADQNPNPCAPYGSCDDSDGVIACRCDPGYDGPRCTLCAPGFGRDANDECLQVVLGGGFETRSDGGLEGGTTGGSVQSQCSELSCNGRGTCHDSNGSTQCTCDVGYASSHCSKCDDGYHRDSLEQCVGDQACAQHACGDHGMCSDSSGVVTCTCDAGYGGTGCDVCAAGFHMSANACVLDQQCLGTTCAGHGTCAANQGQTTCACSTGYSDAHCDSCATSYHHDTTGACAVDQKCTGSECGADGDCVDSTGVIVCSCHAGYAGTACAGCAAGFHKQGASCMLDQTCMATSCSSHATCDASGGTVKCICDPGYQGMACGACLPGYYLDYSSNSCSVFDCKSNPVAAPGTITFDSIAGYPTANNTCVETSVQTVAPLTLTSIAGDGTVWTCAPSAWVQFTSNHVMLEAGTQGAAKIQLAGPITKLSFDYGAYSALGLQMFADGQLVGSLSAARMTHGAQTFTFTTPISVFELRSANGTTNEVAVDNIAYEPPACP